MHAAGASAARAVRALRVGIELGMTHIDTAEMYGDGRAEEIVGEAIAGMPRDSVFVVSKVLPQHGSYEGTIKACEGSLRRLGLDFLDVYLLHWRGSHPLEQTMSALEHLADTGKIRALGVSNFDVDDLKEAQAALTRHPIACDQVLYHLQERHAERFVLPYCQANNIALVAYSPFGHGEFPSARSRDGKVLEAIGQRHNVTARQVALAFLTRLEGTFAIPKAESEAHVRENAAAGDVRLTPEEIKAIDAAFPIREAAELPTL